MHSKSVTETLERELKELIIHSLKLEDVTPEQIGSDEPLFENGLGLDSIDSLEIGVILRKKYSIKIATVTDEVKAHFATVGKLALFILSNREASK